MKGTCISYDRARGFGFIVSTDNPDLPNFFCHYSDIDAAKQMRFLRVGQTVEFEPADIETPRPQAHDVKKFPTAIAVQRGAAPGDQSCV